MNDAWQAWSTQMVEADRRLAARVAQLEEIILGDLSRKPAPGDEPSLIKIIRNVAAELIREEGCLRDRGIWSADTLYGKGATVTYNGAAWVCQVETELKPGDGNAAWRLAVKSDLSAVRKAVREELRKAGPVAA